MFSYPTTPEQFRAWKEYTPLVLERYKQSPLASQMSIDQFVMGGLAGGENTRVYRQILVRVPHRTNRFSAKRISVDPADVHWRARLARDIYTLFGREDAGLAAASHIILLLRGQVLAQNDLATLRHSMLSVHYELARAPAPAGAFDVRIPVAPPPRYGAAGGGGGGGVCMRAAGAEQKKDAPARATRAPPAKLHMRRVREIFSTVAATRIAAVPYLKKGYTDSAQARTHIEEALFETLRDADTKRKLVAEGVRNVSEFGNAVVRDLATEMSAVDYPRFLDSDIPLEQVFKRALLGASAWDSYRAEAAINPAQTSLPIGAWMHPGYVCGYGSDHSCESSSSSDGGSSSDCSSSSGEEEHAAAAASARRGKRRVHRAAPLFQRRDRHAKHAAPVSVNIKLVTNGGSASASQGAAHHHDASSVKTLQKDAVNVRRIDYSDHINIAENAARKPPQHRLQIRPMTHEDYRVFCVPAPARDVCPAPFLRDQLASLASIEGHCNKGARYGAAATTTTTDNDTVDDDEDDDMGAASSIDGDACAPSSYSPSSPSAAAVPTAEPFSSLCLAPPARTYPEYDGYGLELPDDNNAGVGCESCGESDQNKNKNKNGAAADARDTATNRYADRYTDTDTYMDRDRDRDRDKDTRRTEPAYARLRLANLVLNAQMTATPSDTQAPLAYGRIGKYRSVQLDADGTLAVGVDLGDATRASASTSRHLDQRLPSAGHYTLVAVGASHTDAHLRLVCDNESNSFQLGEACSGTRVLALDDALELRSVSLVGADTTTTQDARVIALGGRYCAHAAGMLRPTMENASGRFTKLQPRFFDAGSTYTILVFRGPKEGKMGALVVTDDHRAEHKAKLAARALKRVTGTAPLRPGVFVLPVDNAKCTGAGEPSDDDVDQMWCPGVDTVRSLMKPPSADGGMFSLDTNAGHHYDMTEDRDAFIDNKGARRPIVASWPLGADSHVLLVDAQLFELRW